MYVCMYVYTVLAKKKKKKKKRSDPHHPLKGMKGNLPRSLYGYMKLERDHG